MEHNLFGFFCSMLQPQETKFETDIEAVCPGSFCLLHYTTLLVEKLYLNFSQLSPSDSIHLKVHCTTLLHQIISFRRFFLQVAFV